MSQEGRGCVVADQGSSDKVAQFKIEGRGPANVCNYIRPFCDIIQTYLTTIVLCVLH